MRKKNPTFQLKFSRCLSTERQKYAGIVSKALFWYRVHSNIRTWANWWEQFNNYTREYFDLDISIVLLLYHPQVKQLGFRARSTCLQVCVFPPMLCCWKTTSENIYSRLEKTLWYIILSKGIIYPHLYITIHFKCKLSQSWFLKHINGDCKVSNSLHSLCKYFTFFPKIRPKVTDMVENKDFGKQNLGSNILVK